MVAAGRRIPARARFSRRAFLVALCRAHARLTVTAHALAHARPDTIRFRNFVRHEKPGGAGRRTGSGIRWPFRARFQHGGRSSVGKRAARIGDAASRRSRGHARAEDGRVPADRDANRSADQPAENELIFPRAAARLSGRRQRSIRRPVLLDPRLDTDTSRRTAPCVLARLWAEWPRRITRRNDGRLM
jgi:hypothetical protein